jgi:sialate O-acetylesterase
MRHTSRAILCLLLTPLATLHAADLRLGSPFSDHMVLQREKPVAFWGWADAGESVTVAFDGQAKTATAGPDGKWSLTLDPLESSTESRTLTATGNAGRTVVVQDVLVGEVWFGAGQSNMAWDVGSAKNFQAEKAAANFPLIRYYGEASVTVAKPQAEGKGLWQVCTPENVGRFSAVLYFFGREIHTEVGVPVGLICAAANATHIENWLPAETQSSDPETKAGAQKGVAPLTEEENYRRIEAKLRADYPAKLAAWELAFKSGKARSRDKPWTPEGMIAHIKRKGGPSGLYNGKVFNLAPFTLRGMLWYQGESNTGQPGELYHKQLSRLVTSWRALWADEVPFAWVQLPNFTAPGEGWPRVREAMLQALELPKTGMAITIDIGDATNIHSANKQEAGRRLALWALGTVYGKDVPAISGPLPAGSSVSGNAITVSFKHTNGGLKTQDGGPLKGFQIAGVDRQWRAASARIDGDKVVISGLEIASPVAVRYAWQDNPDCNLYNAAGLPASPFRTDDWPVATVGEPSRPAQ